MVESDMATEVLFALWLKIALERISEGIGGDTHVYYHGKSACQDKNNGLERAPCAGDGCSVICARALSLLIGIARIAQCPRHRGKSAQDKGRKKKV